MTNQAVEDDRQKVKSMSPKVDQAIEFARIAHGDQKRMDGSPYYLHAVRVTMSAIQFGVTNMDALVACPLHDVVEDCPFIHRSNIVSQFGQPVLDIIEELTNDERLPSKYKKLKLVHKAKFLSENAKIIKACDRIDNLLGAIESFDDKSLYGYTIESMLLHESLCYGVIEFYKNPLQTAIGVLKLTIKEAIEHGKNDRKFSGFDELERQF